MHPYLNTILIITFIHQSCSILIGRPVEVTYKDLEQLEATCNGLDSCKNNRTSADNLENYNCNCGKFCVEFGTCCVDSKHRITDHVHEKYNDHHSCVKVYGRRTQNVYMVDSCSENYSGDEGIFDLCNGDAEYLNDPLLAVPVTSNTTSITYKNYFCYVCNGGRDEPKFWTVKVTSDTLLTSRNLDIPQVEFDAGLNSWTTFDSETNQTHIVQMSIHAPENLSKTSMASCRPKLITRCAANWTGFETIQKCEAYMAIVTYTNASYKNPHCAMCNYEDLDNFTCLSTTLVRKGAPNRNQLFVGLFSLDGGGRKCSRGDMYDKFSGKCRSVQCARSDYVVRNRRCVPN